MCFLQRLQAKVLKLVDISYGGENGFNQAIELSAEVLSNVKFIQEKKLIGDSSFLSIEIILALGSIAIQHNFYVLEMFIFLQGDTLMRSARTRGNTVLE